MKTLLFLLFTFSFLVPIQHSYGQTMNNSCSVRADKSDIATRYRATTMYGSAYEVDSILPCALRVGPFVSACVGTRYTNGNEYIIIGQNIPGDLPTGTVMLPTILVRAVTVMHNVIDLAGSSAFTNSWANTPVNIDDLDGYRLLPISLAFLGTCGNGVGEIPEGTTKVIQSSSGNYGTRECFCERLSNDSFRWRNKFNPLDLTGTSTSCPENL